MYKILETLLFTIISYLILLVCFWIFYMLRVVLNDIAEKAVFIGFVLIFVVIFAVIYNL